MSIKSKVIIVIVLVALSAATIYIGKSLLDASDEMVIGIVAAEIAIAAIVAVGSKPKKQKDTIMDINRSKVGTIVGRDKITVKNATMQGMPNMDPPNGKTTIKVTAVDAEDIVGRNNITIENK